MIVSRSKVGITEKAKFPYSLKFDTVTIYQDTNLVLLRPINNSELHTTTTLPRYIMATQIGRFLTPNEKVYVVNPNKPVTINNLRIKSSRIFRLHSSLQKKYTFINFHTNMETGKEFIELKNKHDGSIRFITMKTYAQMLSR